MTEATDKMKELVDKIGRESKPKASDMQQTPAELGPPENTTEELLATMMSDVSQYAEAIEDAYKGIKKPDNIIKVIGKLKGIIALIQTL